MSKDCVNVWVVNLRAERANIAIHKSLLSQDELDRFAEFTNLKQAEYYAVSRAVQRQILANYLGIAPDAVVYQKGLYGKPELVGRQLFFNISHSADFLLLAVSAISEVGVDIELLKERRNLQVLVERCFDMTERRYWRGVSNLDALQIFYRFWVAKEAFVKAVGRGLGLGLANCVLHVPDLQSFRVVPEVYGLADSWSLKFLDVEPGYIAAVVCKSGFAELNLCNY